MSKDFFGKDSRWLIDKDNTMDLNGNFEHDMLTWARERGLWDWGFFDLRSWARMQLRISSGGHVETMRYYGQIYGKFVFYMYKHNSALINNAEYSSRVREGRSSDRQDH